MNPTEKWSRLKEYLKNKDNTILIEVRASARNNDLEVLPKLAAQLVLIEEIIQRAESLDRGETSLPKGRVTPPKNLY